eukprot:758317-Hanusia_phi.AAC.9
MAMSFAFRGGQMNATTAHLRYRRLKSITIMLGRTYQTECYLEFASLRQQWRKGIEQWGAAGQKEQKQM